jgi:GLPGLI family protein
MPLNPKNILMRKWFVALFVIILITGCNNNVKDGEIREGRIEYKITYLNSDEFHFDESLLPRKMILEFNDDYYINIIDGFLGVFRLSNITYFKNNRCTTYLKALDKSYVYHGNKYELMCCFNDMNDMNIEFHNSSKEIAGFNCQKATATFKNSDNVFDIYYTKELYLKNPNSTNPYRELNGVLMEFYLNLGPYKMKFSATDFIHKEPNKKNFHIPEDARKVTREEMTWVLMRILG